MTKTQLPPHSTEAEQGVLGCMLLSPQAIEACLEKLKCGSEAFFDLRHRTIYEAIVSMRKNGEPTDLVTISNRLATAMTSVGGLGYFATLMDIPSAENIGYYLDIMIEKYVLRKAYCEMDKAKVEILQDAPTPQDMISRLERMTIGLRSLMTPVGDGVNIRDRLAALIDIYQKAESGERIPSVPCGFDCIEREIDGWRAGELIAVGARPKIGKSSLGMNVAMYAAKQGYPTGIISLEMTADEVLQRAVAAESGVPSKSAERGHTTDAEKKRMAVAMATIVKSPLMIQDTFTMNVDQIALLLRKWKKDRGLRMAVIDYLQLIDRPRGSNPNEAISEITRKCKNLAGDLGIPIILISQFNREVEKENRAPRLSDFRDSGSIEQDANLIIMLHRNPNDQTDTRVIMVGRRCKSSDSGRLIFHKELNRFENPPQDV